MSRLFSQHHRIRTFRKLWVALARAEMELGLPIKPHQIEQMALHVDKIDFAKAAEYEKRFRHDVMAHIHTFGDQCPDAKPIIHLGATSSFVADNADLIQLKEAMQFLLRKLISVMRDLVGFTRKWSSLPTLSYTHFQSAQPTTVGKRACLWLQDFLWDAEEWERLIGRIPFLGVKGATGTQASFLALFDGDPERVVRLEERVAAEFGFERIWPIAGQTYPRKLDQILVHALTSFAASAHKMATDLRLLSHLKEIVEPFGEDQVGSSAMPYKRNPIYSERVCGLSRFVMSLAENPSYTAATQWLERSLDDSSNRRLAIPEVFLGVDAILNLLSYLVRGMKVNVSEIERHVQEEMPQVVMENILMLAVKKGGSRQAIHEELRKLSAAAQKHETPLKFLMQQAEGQFSLSKEELEGTVDLECLVGRAPEQVRNFLDRDVEPFLSRQREEEISFSPIEN